MAPKTTCDNSHIKTEHDAENNVTTQPFDRNQPDAAPSQMSVGDLQKESNHDETENILLCLHTASADSSSSATERPLLVERSHSVAPSMSSSSNQSLKMSTSQCKTTEIIEDEVLLTNTEFSQLQQQSSCQEREQDTALVVECHTVDEQTQHITPTTPTSHQNANHLEYLLNEANLESTFMSADNETDITVLAHTPQPPHSTHHYHSSTFITTPNPEPAFKKDGDEIIPHVDYDSLLPFEELKKRAQEQLVLFRNYCQENELQQMKAAEKRVASLLRWMPGIDATVHSYNDVRVTCNVGPCGLYSGISLTFRIETSGADHDRRVPRISCLTPVWHPFINAKNGRLALPAFVCFKPVYSLEYIVRWMVKRILNPKWFKPIKKRAKNDSFLIENEEAWNQFENDFPAFKERVESHPQYHFRRKLYTNTAYCDLDVVCLKE